MFQLEKSTLGDLCLLVTDGTHDSPKLQPSGIPFIKAKHISNGFVDFDNCDFITYEDHLKVISRSKPEKGDTLFTHIGASLGVTAYINKNVEFSIKNVALFKPNLSKVDPRYLYYLVISDQFQGNILNKRTGSAQPFVSLDTLRKHEIAYHPEISTQRKLVAILSAYDDLIENNTRRIEILEEMARSLYREWFVNFRFPGHEQMKMVNSEFGLIPEGWEVVPLEKLTHPKKPIQYGVLKPGESDDNGVLLIRGGDILNGTIATNQLRTITKEVSNKYRRTLLEGGEIVVSLVGNPGEVAVVPGKLKGANIARQAGRIVLQKELHTPYVMRFLMSDRGRGELFASTTGSVQKVINIIALKQVRILLPQDSVLHKAVPIFHSIYQYQEILREKIQNLCQTRNLLLPKLISGELDVEKLDINTGEIAA